MKQWKRMKTLLLLTACAVLAVSGCCAEAKDEAAPFVPKVLRYVAVPEDAFGGTPGGRVAAVAEDGNKLLVIGRNSLYLWDAAAGQRIPVYFSQEEDMDLLNDAVLLQCMNGKTTEATLETIRGKMAEYLADHGLERFENLAQAGEFLNLRNGNNGIYICCAGEHFAVAAMFQPWVYFTVDLRTGEARIIECLQQDFEYTDTGTGWAESRGLSIVPMLYGDLLLSDNGVTDLNTGETVQLELRMPDTLPEDIRLDQSTADALAPDGNILKTAATNLIRTDDGKLVRDWYLLDCGADGTNVIRICENSRADLSEMLVTGNGRYVTVSDPNAIGQGAVWMIDRETGDVRSLEDTGWVAVGAYDTGFLCYDLNYGFWPLLAVDPETMNYVFVNLTGTNCPQPTVRTLVGMISNGRYFCPRSDIINGYFIAE